MFETVQSAFHRCLKSLRGETHLDKRRLTPLLEDLKASLLDADVAISVLNPFLGRIESELLNRSAKKEESAEKLFLRTAHTLLTDLFRNREGHALNFKVSPPAVILLVGLQGSGKTTTAAKLALRLKQEGKRILLASVDCYRPAAFEQLKQLGQQTGIPVFETAPTEIDPCKRAKAALAQAKSAYYDVLIVDSAGRTEMDVPLMAELTALHHTLNPIETFLIADAMLGQQAAKIAKGFAEQIPLTGIVLTKLDGGAKAGAAIALTQITQKPIKFLGKGEKLTALDVFAPERMSMRILGVGDMATLLEKFQSDDPLHAKLYDKPSAFTLQDFQTQLEQLEKMGGAESILEHLPYQLRTNPLLQNACNPQQLRKTKAIFLSMTLKEKLWPEIIKFSRKRRIAAGSGTSVQVVNQLLNQYEAAKSGMVRVKQGGMRGLMQQAQSLFGRRR